MNTWLLDKYRSQSNPNFGMKFNCEYPIKPFLPEIRYLVITEDFTTYKRLFHSDIFKYLSRLPDDIRGIADTTLLLVGRYWRHHEFNEDEVMYYCHNHNINVSFLDEP